MNSDIHTVGLVPLSTTSYSIHQMVLLNKHCGYFVLLKMKIVVLGFLGFMAISCIGILSMMSHSYFTINVSEENLGHSFLFFIKNLEFQMKSHKGCEGSDKHSNHLQVGIGVFL